MLDSIKKKFLESTAQLFDVSSEIEEIEETQEIEEALIGFSGVRPHGEFVMLAGGPGSGKGWTLENVLLSAADFKVFDVDHVKNLMIKKISRLNEKKGKIPPFGKKAANWQEFKKTQGTDEIDVDNPEHVKYLRKESEALKIENFDTVIKFFRDAKEGNYWTEKDWNMKDPSTVSLLHGLVAALDVSNKFYNNFFDTQASKPKEEKDNLVADVTGDDIKESAEMLKQAKQAGFRTSVVYVLTSQEVAWYNNISRDRKVAKDVFSAKHATIPATIKKLLESVAQDVDRAFIVFSEPRGEGRPVLDLRMSLPPVDLFRKFMDRKEGESDDDYKKRTDAELAKLRTRSEMEKAIKNLASAAGMTPIEFLKTQQAKGSHANVHGINYGDVVELEKKGNGFDLPMEVKARMLDFITKSANYDIADKKAIPKDMGKYKGWDNFLQEI